MLRPFQSLHHAIAVGVALCILLPALLLGGFAASDRYAATYHARVFAPLQQYADLLVHGLASPLWNVDPDAARQLADAVLNNPDVVAVSVEDSTLGPFVHREYPERRRGEVLVEKREIRRDGQVLGYLAIELATGRVEQELLGEAVKLGMTLLVQLLASFVLILVLLEKRFIKPLQEYGDMTERKVTEATMSANHEFTKKLIESLPGVFYLIDAEGRFVLWNKNFEQVAGRSAEEMARLHPLDLFEGKDREAIDVAMRQVFESGQTVAEAVIVSADGRRTPFLFTGVRLEASGSSQLVGVGIDLTERRLAEDALRASEAKFSAAINGSVDFISLSALTDGSFTLVNEAFERLTGWSAEEAIGRTSVDLGIWHIPEERRELVARLRRGERVSNYNLSLGTRSGAVKECVMSAVTVTIAGVPHMVAVVRDMSEQRRADRELLASQNKFSALFHSSPVAMTVSRRESDYTVIDVNEAWERQFLQKRDEVLGANGIRLNFWKDPEDRVYVLGTVEREGELHAYEAWLQRGDGETILCQVSGKMIAVGGEQLLILAEEDITEKRRIERELSELNTSLEQRVTDRTEALRVANEELSLTVETLRQAQVELVRSEKLAALGSLVAGIAHELNTPIGNCITIASTLDEQIDDFVAAIQQGLRRSTLDSFTGSARQAADILMRNLQRASELVVSFKQVAVDQTSSQRRQFALGEVVAEILLTLQPTIRKTPYVVDYSIPPEIVCDSYPGPLGQVVSNLVNNALLHGFEGRTKGVVSIGAKMVSATHFELTVTDDGCGIPKSHQMRIYDPFFTTKLGKGGSGLGLNIVYNLVTEVLGGDISLDSEPGRGTSFAIVVPLLAPVRVEDEHVQI